MTPEEKLDNIEKQILAVVSFSSDVIICPYCGGENRDDDDPAVCCLLFAKAANAVMDRMQEELLLEKAIEIQEMVSRN